MTQLLNEIVTLGSFRYKGCTITQTPTGWHVLGFRHDTIEQAKGRVDNGYINLFKSIK